MVNTPKISYGHQYSSSDLTAALGGKVNCVCVLANSMLILYKGEHSGSRGERASQDHLTQLSSTKVVHLFVQKILIRLELCAQRLREASEQIRS